MIERRTTKIYLKSLPPLTVHKLVNEYKIPSPYKEILLTVCAEDISGFKALDHLSKTYHINISYWQLTTKLSKALDKFRISHRNFYKNVDIENLSDIL